MARERSRVEVGQVWKRSEGPKRVTEIYARDCGDPTDPRDGTPMVCFEDDEVEELEIVERWWTRVR